MKVIFALWSISRALRGSSPVFFEKQECQRLCQRQEVFIKVRCPAFTLIELLVVIAVLALLLAIFLPALHLAKAKAREVLCRNNLYQLQLCARLYSDDYDVFLPPNRRVHNINTGQPWAGWRDDAVVHSYEPPIGNRCDHSRHGAYVCCSMLDKRLFTTFGRRIIMSKKAVFLTFVVRVLASFSSNVALINSSKKASNPVSPNGATSVDTNVILSWTPGLGAKSHTV